MALGISISSVLFISSGIYCGDATSVWLLVGRVQYNMALTARVAPVGSVQHLESIRSQTSG